MEGQGGADAHKACTEKVAIKGMKTIRRTASIKCESLKQASFLREVFETNHEEE